jgi:lycopene beta-cyclase
MKEFDYIILGGGLSGLSLAFELNKQGCLKNKTLAILEKRKEYQKDKIWSYWDFNNNKFKNCIEKSWNYFTITHNQQSITLPCKKSPYRSINSQKFYKFIINNLNKNKNIHLIKNTKIVSVKKDIITTTNQSYKTKYIFDSLITGKKKSSMYQHFYGCEIESAKDMFNSTNVQLMDFDCEQNNGLHFFYILPFTTKRALIETTWYSKKIKAKNKYQEEINKYLLQKKISGKIKNEEFGAIPLYHFPVNNNSANHIKIGTAGNMTRLSTGYTFQAIQTFSENLAKQLKLKDTINLPLIRSIKYKFLDQILLSVIERNHRVMPKIFFHLFKNNTSKTVINFLCDRSNFIEDLKIIISMPKLIFLQNFFIYICKSIFGIHNK